MVGTKLSCFILLGLHIHLDWWDSSISRKVLLLLLVGFLFRFSVLDFKRRIYHGRRCVAFSLLRQGLRLVALC